jgi:SAM-dependent methyltransferase
MVAVKRQSDVKADGPAWKVRTDRRWPPTGRSAARPDQLQHNGAVAHSADLDQARYACMRWNTPLSEEHAALLLERLGVSSGTRVLDLGCGWGELLQRAVMAGGVDATGIGVDTDAQALGRGRALAGIRGLADRVTFIDGDAAVWRETANRVMCVGASHAWGGTKQALLALADLIRPEGRLLFGDACWEGPPTPAAAALFGEHVLPLETMVAHAVTAGWRVVHLSTADQREWDDFEATWRAGRQQWLLEHPDSDHALEVRTVLDDQLRSYVAVYRTVLGFCYLILAR